MLGPEAEMQTEILKAIRERRVLALAYHPGVRRIIPCTYGVGSSGQALLRAFQIAGASASGGASGWKLFTVGKISSLEATEEEFAYAPAGYRRGDPAMRRGILGEL